MLVMNQPAIWFPTVRAGTGSDGFTDQLVLGLKRRGLQAEVTWLPHHAEYLPWVVRRPSPPSWANIVHVNSWLASRFLPDGLPVITTIHLCVQDPAYQPYKTPLQRLYHHAWVTPLERNMIGRAAKVIAVSRYTANCVAFEFGTEAVIVVHNGIDTAVFCPADRDHTHQPFRILFAGKPSRRKGFDLLPEIMRRLGPGFELYYTSGNSAHMDAESNHMHALPRRAAPETMAETYRDADLLLFPSRLEGFGLVAAEAQACGLPVIASRSSSLPEVVDDGVTGILCPPDDVEAFVQAILLLARDETLRISMSQAARIRATRDFMLDQMVDRYIELYRSMLASSR